MECAALLSYQRYLLTQNPDGGWGYAGPITLKGFPPHKKIPPGTMIPPGLIPPGFFPEGGLPGPAFVPPGPMGGIPPALAPPPPMGGVPPGVVPPGVGLPGLPQGGQAPLGMAGGWGTNTKTKATMTCVGLLGLAMGSGAVPADAKAKDGDKLENPAIQRGLQLLAQFVGTPAGDANARPPMQKLYLLWSIERVAMLYDLKTIGGKDWYGWGAQILLANQTPDGCWSCPDEDYATVVSDTCFALLFLKRSNLMPDLTENLRLHMIIRDPGAR